MAANVDVAPVDNPLQVLREARSQFVQTFANRCEQLASLAGAAAGADPDNAADTLRRSIHQLAGLAGTIGFPTVSRQALVLEGLVDVPKGDINIVGVLAAIGDLFEAFVIDEQSGRESPVTSPRTTGPTAATVLVVEDDPTQRAMIANWLRTAGHDVVEAGSGEDTFAAARRKRPSLILLDIGLPDLDGHAVCRRLKTSPALASVPVVFLTARGDMEDRLAGLALGADDFVQKTNDPRELLLRIERLLKQRVEAVPDTSDETLLSYEAFLQEAQALCAASPVSLALIRLPNHQADRAVARVLDDLRRRDRAGRYDRAHLASLMPGIKTQDGYFRMRTLIESLKAEGVTPMHAGVVGTTGAGEKTIEALLMEADEALTDARYTDKSVSTRLDRTRRGPMPDGTAHGTAVIADDDPEIARIVDAQMRRGGFTTTVVFDGASAAETVERDQPDLLLLDLMMPVLTGFDVLSRLQGMSTRPRIIVLSARGREDDVMRAFELGADDYMTKPFNPQELMARAQRLVK